MADGVQSMTATQFVMRMANGDGRYFELVVRGTDLAYDAETGMITGGTVGSIFYNDVEQVTRKRVHLIEQHSWQNLNTDAGKLGDILGDKNWASVKVIASAFGTLDTLHDSVIRGFANDKEAWTLGSDNADLLNGSSRGERQDGLGGDDRLFGRNGDDALDGGKGDDRLNGGRGNDRMTDASGNNHFSGGTGNDSMYGGSGNDAMTSDAGDDLFYGNGGSDYACGGTGADMFVFNIKQEGVLTIGDFSVTEDHLMNLYAGSAKEAYTSFIDHAKQDGANVVVRDGNMTLILSQTSLKDITPDCFSDALL